MLHININVHLYCTVSGRKGLVTWLVTSTTMKVYPTLVTEKYFISTLSVRVGTPYNVMSRYSVLHNIIHLHAQIYKTSDTWNWACYEVMSRAETRQFYYAQNFIMPKNDSIKINYLQFWPIIRKIIHLSLYDTTVSCRRVQ